jgi:glycosyltransferase involved in cell wall biosynthesis
MKLLTVLITYNRLKYTKRTLNSFIKTVSEPYFLVVVDNSSDDGTQEWLKKEHARGKFNLLILNDDNFYPGKATNQGWEVGILAYPEATHLCRIDNDMLFAPDWTTKANQYFEAIHDLGQLGLEHTAIEGHEDSAQTIKGMSINPWPGNVGGPNIISRAVWDKGLRYDETPWHHDKSNVMPTPQEDCRFSVEIAKAGFLFGHATDKLAWTFADESNWSDYPQYYKKTMKERGYENIHKDLFS